MPFTPKDWRDGPADTSTPISAVALEDLETRLSNYTDTQIDSRISVGQTVSGGRTIIATEQARTNTAYGLMTTPDRVENIVLPADGLLRVGFQGMWKESVDGAARAAIFVGATQLKVASAGNAAPIVQEASCPGSAGTYMPLASTTIGLFGATDSNAVAYTGDVTTGQVLGAMNTTEGAAGSPTFASFGICCVFAAAGTYTVSIQFKASSGSVTASNRKLWVWAQGFT